MVTPSSPFAFVESLFERIGERLQPPAWAIHEVQHRAVLFLNHVLQQEPEAQDRLARQKGRVVLFRWRAMHMRLVATPAGLLDLASPAAAPDLTLTVTEDSPWTLGQAAMRGEKPPVRIEGDVQFAAEVNWLVDHVRWDLEEDLSRIVGDAPAHAIGQAARSLAQALRRFIPAPATPGPSAPPAGPGPA